MFNFTNKNILITGGTRGIGESITRKFIKFGGQIIVTGTTKIPTWIKQDKNITYYELDFLRKNSIDRFLKKISSIDKLDVLVNNAGINSFRNIGCITQDEYEKIYKVNLHGPLRLINELSPKILNDGSKIVNIASIASLVTKKGSAMYTSSKSALVGLTRSAAIDLAGRNILVNAISPGPTNTEMLNNLLTSDERDILLERIPLGRFATAEDVANLALFLCSDLNTYITGQNIVIDGGSTII